MEYIEEAVDIIYYLRHKKYTDPYYNEKKTAVLRRLIASYYKIEETSPGFAGLIIIHVILDKYYKRDYRSYKDCAYR